MQELFYFSFADVMARIEYHRDANALRYATHRTLTLQERLLIEQHLLASFARKTEYFQRAPALFIYLGTEEEPARRLKDFHARRELQKFDDEAITASVGKLIAQALEQYYCERIGDVLLEARRAFAGKSAGDSLQQRKRRKAELQKLIDAYNHYTARTISLAGIVPAELQPCFDLPQVDSEEQPDGMLTNPWRNPALHT
ncbi:MAG: hypothetical protein ONB48_02655 [candidate division KSB1 bacterium]|nr:hypothetical protein [candidate division KSB1 bacterium]MDZ7275755.1 hypothetical protein [candidate division KSB1 bacterium]MDZ7284554.1 hypothetical protein [candidate division KSB1 bacterium]MDZ7298027.1 hypothetical protein [candidate division KSB1 bacterium]MDZ7307742.1 hypothetical protein [candidate division KSB1 bacterium]